MLAELDNGERLRLTRRATKLRQAALRTQKPGARRPELDEFLLELVAPGARRRTGTTAASCKRPPRPAPTTAASSPASSPAPAPCCSTASRSTATLPRDLAGRQQSDLAVGDEVLVERRDDSHRVIAVLPRRSLLARADPHVAQRRRAIAANVDLVVVVVAAEAPPLHPRLIDRYLVAVEQSGARPVLVVNKIDLLDEERRHDLLARLQPYRSLGMPVLPCSAERGEGIEEVRAALAGNTCVFVGQSGVGKSSLLNALDGDVAARDGRGPRRRRPRPPHHDVLGALRPPRRHPRDRHAGHPPVQSGGRGPGGHRRRLRRVRGATPPAAASATAPTCTSPAAPSSAPSPTARSRAAGT